MNRKKRIVITLVLFWSVILGVAGLWLWREDRQQNLNQHLIAAVKQEDAALALRALEQGADPNTRDEHGSIPGWLRIWYILQGHPLPPSTARTPLLIALQNRDAVDNGVPYVRTEYPEVVSALLANGARVDAADTYGRTPLFYALFETKPATARLLIEHGADVSAEPDHESLLLAAIRYANDAATIELLLQHGAHPNPQNAQALAPLELAVLRGEPAAVKSLLNHHADPHHLSKALFEGLSAVKYAEKHHMAEIAAMLRAAGASE